MTKASLCIPMAATHLRWLENLFQSIAKYSVLPEEIVISASNVPNLKKGTEYIQEMFSKAGLENKTKLSCLITNQHLSVGANRNNCIEKAIHDLLIFHDADDIAHPDRVGILKHIFDNNQELVSLNQNYRTNQLGNGVYNDIPWETYIKETVYSHHYFNTEKYKNTRTHCGVPAIRKSKIGNIRYKEHKKDYIICEDQDFTIELIEKFGFCMYVNEILYEYRLGNNLHGIYG